MRSHLSDHLSLPSSPPPFPPTACSSVKHSQLVWTSSILICCLASKLTTYMTANHCKTTADPKVAENNHNCSCRSKSKTTDPLSRDFSVSIQTNCCWTQWIADDNRRPPKKALDSTKPDNIITCICKREADRWASISPPYLFSAVIFPPSCIRDHSESIIIEPVCTVVYRICSAVSNKHRRIISLFAYPCIWPYRTRSTAGWLRCRAYCFQRRSAGHSVGYRLFLSLSEVLQGEWSPEQCRCDDTKMLNLQLPQSNMYSPW